MEGMNYAVTLGRVEKYGCNTNYTGWSCELLKQDLQHRYVWQSGEKYISIHVAPLVLSHSRTRDRKSCLVINSANTVVKPKRCHFYCLIIISKRREKQQLQLSPNKNNSVFLSFRLPPGSWWMTGRLKKQPRSTRLLVLTKKKKVRWAVKSPKPLHSTLVSETQFTDKSKTTFVRTLGRNMWRAIFWSGQSVRRVLRWNWLLMANRCSANLIANV